MTIEELAKELEKANSQIEHLNQKIARLERIESLDQQLMQLEHKLGHNSLPDTMILDDSFIKRAFAIYGHVLVAGLIIALPFYCLAFLLSMVG